MSTFFDEIWRRYKDPDIFITNLLERMRFYGITQTQLAARSGFDDSHVSRWIGKTRSVVPTMETMVMLDEAVSEIIEVETVA